MAKTASYIPYSYAERVAYAKHRKAVRALLREAKQHHVPLLPMTARNSVRNMAKTGAAWTRRVGSPHTGFVSRP